MKHFEVYQAKASGISWICSGSIHYAATRGETSEVLNALALSGSIPAKYANKYHDATTITRFGISYIVPKNQPRN